MPLTETFISPNDLRLLLEDAGYKREGTKWVQKYSPDQPRDENGQWASGTSGVLRDIKANIVPMGPIVSVLTRIGWLTHGLDIKVDPEFESLAERQKMNLTKDQWDIVKGYTAMSNKVNDVLRNDLGAVARFLHWDKKKIDNLIAVVNSAKLPESKMLYRGAIFKDVSVLKRGNVFSDKGFISTTTNPAEAYRYAIEDEHSARGTSVLFRVASPKGSIGLVVPKQHAYNPDSHEVILPPSSRFEITKVEEVKTMSPEFSGLFVTLKRK